MARWNWRHSRDWPTPSSIFVSTGSTLKANNLIAVEEIVPISSRLIVNRAAMKVKRARLQPLIEAFEGLRREFAVLNCKTQSTGAVFQAI